MPTRKRSFEDLLQEPLDVDPLDGFGEAFAAANAAYPLPRAPARAPLAPPPPEPEVEIDLEGPPTIRSERPAAPPPPAAPAPPGRMGLGRMVPLVPGRPSEPAPAPSRSPLRPAAGGRPELGTGGSGRDAVGDLLQSQRHDALVRDANSVGDALYGAFTRSRPAAARGTDMAGEFAAREGLADKELARAKAGRLERSAAIDADPTSEASRAAQAMGQQLLPGFLPPETWSRLSKAQIEKMFPELADIEKSRAIRDAARTKREEDRTNKLADTESARKYQQQRDARLDTTRMQRAEVIAGAKKDAAGDKSLEDLMKQMPPEAAALVSKLDKMTKLIGGTNPDSPDDIPGIGPAEGRVPDWAEPYVLDEEGQDVRQLAKGVVSMMLKMQSGATVSEPEKRAKLMELGMGPGNTARQFRTGMNNLRDEMAATLRHKAAGFAPATVQKFREHGGVTAEDVEGLGKSATVKVRHKPSGKVKELSGSAARRALADPDFEEAR